MFRKILFVALLTTLSLSAQDEIKQLTKLDKKDKAEIKLLDGSKVIAFVLQEDVEIITRYGKLTVPYKEIGKIELGRHYPPGIEDQIQEELKKLGDDKFQVREAAQHKLINYGPLAYDLLVKTCNSPEMEIQKRAIKSVEILQNKFLPAELSRNVEDTIYTKDQTVKGKIISDLKVRSEVFGEHTIGLHHIDTITAKGQNFEIVIDVEKHNDTWLDSGCYMQGGLKWSFFASGKIDMWPQGPGQYVSSPNGINIQGRNSQHMAGTLVGKIGEKGEPFVIGEKYAMKAYPTNGERLYLKIIPSPWNNVSSGKYHVKVIFQ